VRGFDEFFHEEYESVVRAITLVFDDRHRAEDFAQFAFARAYREMATRLRDGPAVRAGRSRSHIRNLSTTA
jgi:DNA-directed RNA polymerase specialized sigma24 family protein